MKKQLTIFEFKDAVASLLLPTQAKNETPYSHKEVLERLIDVLKSPQAIDVPVSQYDIDECFTPLVDNGVAFEWEFNTEAQLPITIRFIR